MELVAFVIACALIEYMIFGVAVGRARTEHGVNAPAVTGPPVFERTMRATATENPLFRHRLLDWMKYRIQQDENSREATLAEGRKHAALFDASDCPAPLREAFKQLGSAN